ncbi:proteasome subunit alpha type-7-like protein, partial [Tanacetum coccineum]
MKRSEMVLSRSKAQMKKDMELMMKEIKSLSQLQSQYSVVESGGKNIEVAVMTREGLRQLEEAELETIVVEIKAEKAAAEAAKKDPDLVSLTFSTYVCPVKSVNMSL